MADSKKVVDARNSIAHKQKRAMLTRRDLLRSARAIFASQGFEHARIEDIASKAGKTRGAFYANFSDKEDVFYAIFEENIDRDMAHLSPLLLSLPTPEQRIAALGDYLLKLTSDRERILLNLEFKLYAIRHPRKRKRLADLYARMCVRSSIPELTELLPQLSGNSIESQLVDTLAISGILDGLALSHLFDPEVLGGQELARYLQLCLREMLQGSPAPETLETSRQG